MNIQVPVDKSELLDEVPKHARAQFINDVGRLEMYTYLAKMLSAEDIIVRWNVRGMTTVAQMNYATRVLDVAPIRREHEYLIPGLILHEIGHFIFSENTCHFVEGGHHRLKLDKLAALREKIKNHRIWNIIEDGYIERRLVAKWPGALKHLWAVFDHFDGTHAKRHWDCTFYETFDAQSPAQRVTELINMMNINVLGAKFNVEYAYPKSVPGALRALLQKAVSCMGPSAERIKLSNEITKALVEYGRRGTREPSLKGAPGPSGRCAEVAAELEGVPAEKMIDVQADAITTEPTELAELAELEKLNSVLSADMTIERLKATRRASASAAAPAEEAPAPDVASPRAEGPKEEAAVDAPGKDDGAGDGDGDGDAGNLAALEEFVSNSKAEMLGNNLSWLVQQCESDTADGAPAKDFSERFLPTTDQVLELSNIEDLVPADLQELLKSTSFQAFAREYSNGKTNKIKNLPAIFNKKLMKARSIAQLMFQHFTIRANAPNITRAQRRQTGSLDPTRAALYKIYDDVFKKTTLAPNQINHGYVLMVDWSSSMAQTSIELFHRIAELIFFAQLAKVELEIWLYTTVSINSERSYKSLLNKLNEKRWLFQPGLGFNLSNFVKVLNTSQHFGDALTYRLFAMFVNAIFAKSGGGGLLYYSSFYDARQKRPLNNANFVSATLVKQRNTNIFEAVAFALERAEKLKSARRTILLLTDGEDAMGFSNVIPPLGTNVRAIEWESTLRSTFPASFEQQARTKVTRVMFNGIDLTELVKVFVHDNNYCKLSPPFLSNFRSIATALLVREAARRGISVTGVTWGNFTSANLRFVVGKNLIRVETPTSVILDKAITKHADVKNTFITNMTEALLSNITNAGSP